MKVLRSSVVGKETRAERRKNKGKSDESGNQYSCSNKEDSLRY